MKEVIQRQKDAVCTLGIVFSIKHPLSPSWCDIVSGS